MSSIFNEPTTSSNSINSLILTNDIKLDEFVNRKEDLGEILRYGGPHPKSLDKHNQRNERDDDYHLLDSSLVKRATKIKDWKEDRVYKKNKLPNIVVWMEEFWGTKRMQPFYNVIEV